MSTSSRHIVIAGGGTGGHLFPGIAVAEEFRRIDPDVRITFVGTERGIEARKVPQLGYDLEVMHVEGLKGRGALGMLKGAVKLPMAGIEAMRLVRKLKPSMVVAVGGYAAGPITMCAATMGVPTAVMEQNSVPGVTNRALGKVAKRVFLTYASSREFFPEYKCDIVGNPLRQELLEHAASFRYTAPDPEGPIRLFVLGGSGGSLALNQLVPGVLCALDPAVAQRLVVRHQVGKQSGDIARQAYDEGGFAGDVEVVEFIEDMASAYAETHLMVCRAGATTIAEVLAFGLPAIYIPFPGASDDHQTQNAVELTEQGAAVTVAQHELESGRLGRLLQGLLGNPEALANMSQAARGLARPEAGATIARSCLEIIEQ